MNQLPDIELTDSALQQIKLIQQLDYTLSGLSFRVKIGGKGCGGFTYETGFSEKLSDDLVLNCAGVEILMDPFTAHYSQQCRIDFRLDPEANDEGFVVENFAGDRYRGKFFKDPTLLPPPPPAQART